MNNPNQTKKAPKFNPTSQKVQYIDTSFGYQNYTSIYYQLGEKGGKTIVCYFIDDNFASMRELDRNVAIENFKPEDHGGQNLHTAQYQRETCLVNIIKSLFERFQFNIVLEPKLGDYQPDISINKEDFSGYIEVKAYHESYICGDPEISQCMRYFEVARQLNPAKVILITSGELIKPQDSVLSNTNKNPMGYIKKFYKKRIITRRQANTLDLFSARNIYRQAAKKFDKKFSKITTPVNVKFLRNKNIAKFPSCLTNSNNYDVLLVRANHFLKILHKEKMFKEIGKFKTLRKESLERLIINANLIEI